MTFFLDLEPPSVTHQSKGIFPVSRTVVQDGKLRTRTRVQLVDRPALEQAKKDYEALLAFHRPRVPLDGPLYFSALFCFSLTKEQQKKGITCAYHERTPDLDNMTKTLLDCMARLKFFTNDSRVCDQSLAKIRCQKPGIWIRLEPLTRKPHDYLQPSAGFTH